MALCYATSLKQPFSKNKTFHGKLHPEKIKSTNSMEKHSPKITEKRFFGHTKIASMLKILIFHEFGMCAVLKIMNFGYFVGKYSRL